MEKIFLSNAGQSYPLTVDEQSRTLTVLALSGAPISRSDFQGNYELHFDMTGCDLTRLASGRAPLLDNHLTDSVQNQIGVVESARIENGQLKAQLRFSDRPDVDPIWNDVRDGILRNVSLGLSLQEIEETPAAAASPRIRTARKWLPFEISFVPVPADAGAQTLTYEEEKMNTITERETLAKKTDQDEIRQIVKLSKLNADFGENLIKCGFSLETAREKVLEELAARSGRNEIISSNASITLDESDAQRNGMVEALCHRLNGGPITEAAKPFYGGRLADYCQVLNAQRGLRAKSMSPSEAIQLALTTCDLPSLLVNTGTRSLLPAYQAAQSALKQAARQSTAPDFRAKYSIRRGEAPGLVKVGEHGEITHGAVAESAETYSLASYARIFGLTRQAMINDDLGAFSDFVGSFGQAAATCEAKLLVDLLTANSGVGPTLADGSALFTTGRGNLAASGAALSLTTLSAARLAMRIAKGIDGTTPIAAAPKYLIVPAAQETLGEQILSSITANVIANANVFSGKLQLLVEPRLDANSTTAWYLAADPGQVSSLEYSYLESAEGPRLESRLGWEVDGIEFKCVLDFGCGVIDWRGLYRNAGA